MRPNAIKLSRRHRAWLYSIFLVLFLTGAIWFVLDRLGSNSDPTQTFQTWMLKLHGAAAMLSLVALGTLIPIHIRRGWTARRNRVTGLVVISVSVLLMITGYGLYYAGGEILRKYTSALHIIVGLAGPVLLIWHIFAGRRNRLANRAHPAAPH